ncbi:MAG: diaminopimelate epimerase [Sebaldella sp.]|nr:diaminopimelate epimerase [Sebaldella sp.]
MLKLKFEKYHGLGNDFVIFDEKELKDNNIEDYSKLASSVCDRHFGIGGDGIIILRYVDNKPFMLYYNSDGSQAPMCGNGIRCFAYYLKNNNLVTEDTFVVKTVPGDLTIETQQTKDQFLVRVNMGKPIFDTQDYINSNKERFIEEFVDIDGETRILSYLFTGTDHVVTFVQNLDDVDIVGLGQKIENHKALFPKKTNVNFTQIIDKNNINVTTWERGAGLTLACGTGAVAAAVLTAFLGRTSEKINVKVPGGTLVIEYPEFGKEAFMTGPSEKVAEGYYNYRGE